MPLPSNNSFVKFIFYGNYFYGICTLALSVEASLQNFLPLNSAIFYLLVFTTTVAYYTKAYMTDTSVDTINQRTLWYSQHRKFISISQPVLLCITGIGILIFSYQSWKGLISMTLLEWVFVLIFPTVAVLYYGINTRLFGKYNIREIGRLKPFFIGFTWAGFVTIYPLLVFCIENDVDYEQTSTAFFLFLKNFMFITILCIMFDIKDYAMDAHHHLNTFVVKSGLRKTIFHIIIPFSILVLSSLIIFGTIHHFKASRIIINVIPLLLLILVGYSLRFRRSTLYYLVVVDGLMLVKAICGIVAMMYF